MADQQDTPVPVMNPAQLAALARIRADSEWIAGPLPGGSFLADNRNSTKTGSALLIAPDGTVSDVMWWSDRNLYDAAALAAVGESLS